MTTLLILLSIVLLGVIAVQVGRLTEITASLRNADEVEADRNKLHAVLGLIFLVGFMVFCAWSAYYYRTDLFAFPANVSASEHGFTLDRLFYITLIPTGIVFVLCHVALFWFAYKYRGEKGRKVLYLPHDNKLEVIWTAIPAVVMTVLVIFGLVAWNDIMSDVPEGAKAGKDYIEVEATGMQFAWILRHPGKDNLLGTKNFRLIGATNSIGQDWKDAKNHDDVITDELVLPVNKTIRVRITARDVLHNFYLPHFRVKMDAIPGMPTYFVFKPVQTTEERRQELKKIPEWQELDKEGKPRWASFEYELACAEMCGQGHFSMRKIVKIVSQAEYDKWLNDQKPLYTSSIQGTVDDTYGKESAKPAHGAEQHEDAHTSTNQTKTEPISMK
jgi:cytochrome c oxidase subunit II